MYDYDSVIHENIFLIHHFIYHYVIHFTKNISDTLKTFGLDHGFNEERVLSASVFFFIHIRYYANRARMACRKIYSYCIKKTGI